MKNKVFLGGTCLGFSWRKTIIANLQIDYFNPVVDDWNEECQQIEEDEKANKCDIHLYVITSSAVGAFSIAEAIESSMTPGKTTILHILPSGFSTKQIKSFGAICNMVRKHGGIAYIDGDLFRTVNVLNYCFK